MNNFFLMYKHESIGDVNKHLNVLILNEMVHFNFIPQGELSQFKEDIHIVSNDSE